MRGAGSVDRRQRRQWRRKPQPWQPQRRQPKRPLEEAAAIGGSSFHVKLLPQRGVAENLPAHDGRGRDHSSSSSGSS